MLKAVKGCKRFTLNTTVFNILQTSTKTQCGIFFNDLQISLRTRIRSFVPMIKMAQVDRNTRIGGVANCANNRLDKPDVLWFEVGGMHRARKQSLNPR